MSDEPGPPRSAATLLDPTQPSLAHAETAGGAAARDEVETPAGATIGRYVLLHPLGRGGMGRVIAAYDSALDRKVAIKLVSPRARGITSAEARERLLREARAMARLSHPNVLTVHEVGTQGDLVYLAMDHASGGTLREWMRTPRPWREVVRRFVAAARGLAAAHAAGLVHRDFKPENVLLGDDGRILVADFGLVGVGVASIDDSTPVAATTTPVASPLTQVGQIVGTPAYMAPEQHRRAAVDARADQFALCAALYEALYGHRPFAADTYGALVDDVSSGRVRPPPADTDVPRWLHAVVVRGLSADPDARYPTMHDLIAALEAEPGQARRGARTAALAALAAAGAAATVMLAVGDRAAAPAVCTQAPEEAERVWGPARRAQLDAALTATDRPGAATTARQVGALLDARAAAWIDMRTAACRATHVAGTQSARALDLRMRCLDDRLERMDALVVLLTTAPDGAAVDGAIVAATRLPSVARCADLAALEQVTPPPDDDAARAEIDRVRAAVAEVLARIDLGQYEAAVALAAPTLDAARATGHGPVIAEALAALGRAATRAGDAERAHAALSEGLRVASAASDDALVARIGAHLVHLDADLRGRPAEAVALRPFVDAAYARPGAGPRDEWLNTQIIALTFAGAFDEALAVHGELEALLADSPADELARLEGWLNAGSALLRWGKWAEALAAYERAHAGFARVLGADNPRTASAETNIASALDALGRPAEALPRFEHAIAVLERTLGPDHPSVATNKNNLAGVHYQLGDHAAARRLLEEALEVIRRRLGDAHPDVGYAIVNLGNLDLDAGDATGARARGREVLALWEQTMGVANANLLHPLDLLARAEVELGHADAALALVDRALGLLAAHPGDPLLEGSLRFVRARALDQLGRDRAEATALARQSLEAFLAGGGAYAQQVAEVRAWLDRR